MLWSWTGSSPRLQPCDPVSHCHTFSQVPGPRGLAGGKVRTSPTSWFVTKTSKRCRDADQILAYFSLNAKKSRLDVHILFSHGFKCPNTLWGRWIIKLLLCDPAGSDACVRGTFCGLKLLPHTLITEITEERQLPSRQQLYMCEGHFTHMPDDSLIFLCLVKGLLIEP